MTGNDQRKEEINKQTQSSELETKSSEEDIANNIENELGSNNQQKEELLIELQENNKAMKIEIDKLRTIAATSQSQYISLKSEFDNYVRRVDSEKRELKTNELKKIVTKFSKLLEQFRLFLTHLDSSLSDNAQIQGLKLMYDSFLNQELSQMGVFQIQSLGLEPNSNLHEVLLIQEASEHDYNILINRGIKLKGEIEEYSLSDLTGLIIQELEVGYYYFDGEKKIIIKPSKVIVAS